MQITSASNEKVKHARRVRDGREAGQIFIEGLRLAEEAAASGLTIDACFYAAGGQETGRTERLLARLNDQGTLMLETTVEILQGMGDTVQSQGIILIAQRPVEQTTPFLNTSSTLLLACDRLQDPGNLGTLIRTAEAAGAGGLVCLKGCADIFSPKVLRSSMGSAFRLPLLADATAADLQALQKQRGFQMVAAAGEGELDYAEYDWRQPTLLLLGNEGRGVEPALMQQCDVRLKIPMQAGVESLNVAAAGAVMLFEAARQRRLNPQAVG